MGDRDFINASVWSDYDKKQPLGAGNFASVFLAEHKKNPGMMVAVKTCNSCDAPKVKVMEKEFKCLDKAQHDHVVDLCGAYNGGGETSLVLEFAQHGDLVTYLTESASNRLTERKVLSIMKQLLQAVGFLHSNGYVHRDIKPHNILVVKKEPHLIVKLADFGLVKEVKVGSLIWARQNSAGDGDFLAPDVVDAMEQAMPVRAMEYVKNDAFALGCVMYYLLSGSAPQKDNLDSAFDNPSIRFPNVTAPAIDLCRMLMHPRADNRLTVDEALAHDWIQSGMMYRQSTESMIGGGGTSSSQHPPSGNASPQQDLVSVDEASPLLNQGSFVPETSFVWTTDVGGGESDQVVPASEN